MKNARLPFSYATFLTVGLEENRKTHVRAVQIDNLPASVYQLEGERLEVRTSTHDVILLVLGHV